MNDMFDANELSFGFHLLIGLHNPLHKLQEVLVTVAEVATEKKLRLELLHARS